MKKRVLNIKAKQKKQIGEVARSLGFLGLVIVGTVIGGVINNRKVEEPEVKEIKVSMEVEVKEPEPEPEPEPVEESKVDVPVEPTIILTPSMEKTVAKWQEVGSPIAHKIEWVYREADVRGLNPELVIAVMALESGWGKSQYCQVEKNCFGWGYTDSGDMGYEYPTFEQATNDILDSLAQYYLVDTAEEMSARGYNTRQTWINDVNIIMSYFK